MTEEQSVIPEKRKRKRKPKEYLPPAPNYSDLIEQKTQLKELIHKAEKDQIIGIITITGPAIILGINLISLSLEINSGALPVAEAINRPQFLFALGCLILAIYGTWLSVHGKSKEDELNNQLWDVLTSLETHYPDIQIETITTNELTDNENYKDEKEKNIFPTVEELKNKRE